MTRRDNGLHATSYDRLLDVETSVVDGLLDRLRDEEVAAYAAPTDGRRGPYGDTVLPDAPSDSVYVDSARRDHARVVVDRYLAEIREELAWAGIVAGFDAPSSDAVPRWPTSEDVEPDDEPGSRPGRLLRPASETSPTSLGFDELRDAVHRPAEDSPSKEAEGLAGPEDHFEPPVPPPIPVPDTVGRFAWAAVLGGPVFLVVATLLHLDISGWPGLFALAAFMGGFVTLVARMKDRPPTDSGPDDGAVV